MGRSNVIRRKSQDAFNNSRNASRRQTCLRRSLVESLEPRLALSGAPVATDDLYTVLQNGQLQVYQAPTLPSAGEYPGVTELGSISIGFQPSKVEYSAEYNLLFAWNGSQVNVFDTITRTQVDSHTARESFTDIDMSPDGRYLFVADFGGENTGYGTPSRPHYVHRFDSLTRTWEVKQAPRIVWRIEAIDGRRFAAQESDQWVDVSLNDFGATAAATIVETSRASAGYSGDMEYDPATARIHHVDYYRDITTYKVNGGQLQWLTEGTSPVGTAPITSTDGRYLFLGKTQVSAESPTTHIRSYPEDVLAAGAGVVITSSKIYNAETGEFLATTPFGFGRVATSRNGAQLWTATGSTLRQFRIPFYGGGVLANDIDAEHDHMTAALVAGPAHGVLDFRSDGRFTYQPNTDYTGADSFSYHVTDASGTSNTATVTINVIAPPANSAPIANPDAYAVPTDGVLNVGPAPFTGLTQIDSLPFSAGQIEYSSHYNLLFLRDGAGRVRIIDVASKQEVGAQTAIEQFTDMDLTADGRYLFVADYGGTNTGYGTPSRPHWVHRYDAQTRTWETKRAPTIAYRIEAVDARRFVVLEQDQHVDFLLNDFGANPASPIVETSRTSADYYGDVEYDPNTGRVFHGSSGSSSQEIHTAIVNGSTITRQEDTGTYGSAQGHGGNNVIGTDGRYFYYGRLRVNADNVRTGNLVMPGAILAASGGVAFAGGGAYYLESTGESLGSFSHPASAFAAGEDRRSIWVSDYLSQTLRHYRFNSGLSGVLNNDTDADNSRLTAELVSGPTHGTLKLRVDGTFEYTPNSGFVGIDSFTYRVNDGFGGASDATVRIEVGNDPPVAPADSYQTDEDARLIVPARGVLSNDTDPEGDSLTAVLVSRPVHGQLSLNPDGSFDYTPDANYFGVDSFTYRASDGLNLSPLATVTINVSPRPDAPTAAADNYAIAERTALTIPALGVLANDLDVDGHALTAVLVIGPDHGSLTLNANGGFVYQPASNYFGTDTFSYRASDGTHESASTLVTIVVRDVPDAPTAQADSYSVNEDAQLEVPAAGVLSNDTDLDGNPLTAALVTPPAHGTVTLRSDGSLTYRPAANYFGPDSFVYRASDGSLNSANTTVSITVVGQPDPPVAGNNSYSVDEDLLLGVTGTGVLNNDSDPDSQGVTAVLATGPAHGQLQLNSNGTFTYRPDANYSGADSFIYRASDGTLLSSPATVTITVRPVNDAPTATADRYFMGTSLNISAAGGVLANDADVEGSALSAVLVTGPAHGALTLRPDGSFTYTPAAGFQSEDSFRYRVSDGQLSSAPVTVTIAAGFIIRAENVTVVSRPGQSVEGYFDVYLDVAAGLNVEAAGYEVVVTPPPANSGVTFLSVEMASSNHPALFEDQLPQYTLVNGVLRVTDVASNASTIVRDDAGLFRVKFSAAAGVIGTFPVAFDRSFTNLGDGNGDPLPLGAVFGGTIDVIRGIPPKIADVGISGTQWTSRFRDFLGTNSGGVYWLPHGEGQLDELPWVNLDQVHVRFSEDVQVKRGDLAIYGVNVAEYSIQGFNYDSATHVASWSLSSPIASDKMLLHIAAAGADPIRDIDGYILDGEWTNGGTQTTSGDDTSGGDFKYRLNVQPGDVDRSGRTNVFDVIKTRNKQFTSTGDEAYSILFDIDGSGSTNVFDTVKARNNQFTALPDPEPVVPQPLSVSAPSAIEDVLASDWSSTKESASLPSTTRSATYLNRALASELFAQFSQTDGNDLTRRKLRSRILN